jgi:peptidoglycan hydrolase-like amidase
MMLALVTISVFGLFHPVELEVRPMPGGVIVVKSGEDERQLEGSRTMRLRSAALVTGRDGAPARFILSVPGKIRREFFGTLEIRAHAAQLLAIMTMDRETAVASVVAAESPPGAPMESRKAQAVVARSFLIAARGRHEGFDFCDTTHCQFLREPAAAGSAARRAQEATAGLALTYAGRPIAALYSANCGGHTRTLEEAGWQPGSYPYFAVECPVRGDVSGHRIGMCQTGAAELARRGATFREILSRYFPAAAIEETGR